MYLDPQHWKRIASSSRSGSVFRFCPGPRSGSVTATLIPKWLLDYKKRYRYCKAAEMVTAEILYCVDIPLPTCMEGRCRLAVGRWRSAASRRRVSSGSALETGNWENPERLFALSTGRARLSRVSTTGLGWRSRVSGTSLNYKPLSGQTKTMVLSYNRT